MAEHRDLKFRLDDSIRWIEAVLAHPGSTDFDVSLAVAISGATDRASGRCIRSQLWLAGATGRTDRAVREGTERMVANGLLLIDRSETQKKGAAFGGAGRGKANVYEPIAPPRPVPKTGTSVPVSDDKTGTSVPHFEKENRNGSTGKQEREYRKTGTSVPPYPINTQSSSQRGGGRSKYSGSVVEAADRAIERLENYRQGGSVAGALRDLEREWTSDGGVTIDHDPIGDAWPMVKAAVIGRHGERARSFLDRLTLRGREDSDVVLTATGSFYVDTVKRDYGDTLLAAWRAEHSWIRSVRVVLGMREAAQ
jgi:hypothetical protein